MALRPDTDRNSRDLLILHAIAAALRLCDGPSARVCRHCSMATVGPQTLPALSRVLLVPGEAQGQREVIPKDANGKPRDPHVHVSLGLALFGH